MERGRLFSLKRRISQGKLRDVVGEILSLDERLPDELVVSIREALAAGQVLDSGSLGKLVISTRDRSLFQIPEVHTTILSSWDVLGKLLHAGIPDKSIERRLCEELASDFDQNRYDRRQFMLEALRDCGTIDSLDTLEAIEYDFFGRHKLAESVLNGLPDVPPTLSPEFVEHTIKKTDIFLGRLIKETIEAARQRNEVGDDLWGLLAQRGDPFSRAGKYRDAADKHLKNDDLGASLNYVRKATEAMLKTVIELQKIRPDKGEPIEKMQLPTLMAIMMDKKYGRTPDKSFHKFLEQLRDTSTLGSHDQGEETENLFSPNMVKGQIETFDKVLAYFRDYVDVRDST